MTVAKEQAQFRVNVLTGDNVTYQWQELNASQFSADHPNATADERSAAFTNIKGETGAVLSLTGIDKSAYESTYIFMTYRCVVTDGESKAVTNEAMIAPDPAWKANIMQLSENVAPAMEASSDWDIRDEDGERVLYGYSGNATTVTIPSGVTKINSYAMGQNDTVINLTIPNSVTEIGYAAFGWCANLYSVQLPANLVDIPADCFFGCEKLTKITLPASIRTIGDNAFHDCKALVLSALPSKLTYLGQSCFSGCSKITISSIPSTVTSIGSYAFEGCDSITSMTFPASVPDLPSHVMENCDHLASVTLAEGVSTVGYQSFYNSTLKTISLPSTLLAIGDSAFSYSGITALDLKNVQTIGEYAFYQCPALTTVVLPDTVTSVGQCAFRNCDALTSFTFSKGMTSVPKYILDECDALNTVVIAEGIDTIEFRAFSDSSLKSVTLPSTLSIIGSYAFENTQLTSLVLPDNTAILNDHAFAGSTLTSINLRKVNVIDEYAFYACDSLKQVTLPSSTTSVGNNAFRDCDALTKFTFSKNMTNVPKSILADCDALDTVIIPDGITQIDGMAFYFSDLKHVTLPSTLLSIGFSAFEATNLAQVTLPSRLESIGENAFWNCPMTDVTIPASVTTIGYCAFTAKTGNEQNRLTVMRFLGNAPTSVNTNFVGWPGGVSSDFHIVYKAGKQGFTTPTWMGYPCYTAVTTAPTMGNATVISSSQLKLTWSAVAGAAHYEVWRSASPSGTYTKLGITANTTYTDTHCLFGKLNYYKVRVYFGTTYSYGNFSGYRTCFGLSTPGIQSLTPSSGTVRLTAATVANATGYYVYRCNTLSGTYTRLGTTTLSGGSNTYTDRSVTNGRTYYYKVRAYHVSASGVTYVGPFSMGRSVTVGAGVALSKPTMGTATVINSSQLKISWNRVANATSYELWRGASANGTYTKIGTTTGTSYTDMHCLFGKLNYYKVRAVATVNGTSWYSTFSGYRTCFGLSTPGISFVDPMIADGGYVYLECATVANATGYYVYRSDTMNGTYTRIGTAEVYADFAYYADYGASIYRPHYYKVRAYHTSSAGVTYVGPFSRACGYTYGGY